MRAERTIRLALDINVFIADILSTEIGCRNTAASFLVEAVRTGTCPAGSVQLVTSLPIIENFANVLSRRLGYDAAAAEERAWVLQQYAFEGPMPDHPYLSVGERLHSIRNGRGIASVHCEPHRSRGSGQALS